MNVRKKFIPFDPSDPNPRYRAGNYAVITK